MVIKNNCILSEENIENKITIDILGDISLAWYSANKDTYLKMVKVINEQIGKVDYRIANLESPFWCGGHQQPIPKESPESNLRVDEKYADFIGKLDIDAYTLANNHLGDFGVSGIKDTINVLENLKKQYVGASLKYENTYIPLRVEIGNLNISFVSVCENEFGVAGYGKIGAAGFKETVLEEVIEKESRWADLKIVIFHGGTEHFPFPTPKQKQRYHWLVNIGADIVIGMHQHCPVGYEYYQKSLIIYGLGNFFFPRKKTIIYENWNIGYIARLFIGLDLSIDFKPIPYVFDNDGEIFHKVDRKVFDSYYAEISQIIQNDKKLEWLYKGWVLYSGSNHYSILKHCMANDNNIYSFDIVKNMFTCEAHNELLTAYVNLRYYESDKDYLVSFKAIQNYINVFHFGMKNNEKQDDRIGKEGRYVLWGVGEKAEKICRELKKRSYEISIIDKDFNKQGFYFMGSKIEAPELVIKKNMDAIYYICTSEMHMENIKSFLHSHGIPEWKIRKG